MLGINPKLTHEKVKSILEEIDVNTMTPIEAMMKLNELKKLVREKR